MGQPSSISAYIHSILPTKRNHFNLSPTATKAISNTVNVAAEMSPKVTQEISNAAPISLNTADTILDFAGLGIVKSAEAIVNNTPAAIDYITSSTSNSVSVLMNCFYWLNSYEPSNESLDKGYKVDGDVFYDAIEN